MPQQNAGSRVFSADAMVLTSNIVTVMGPTPPGTGVMKETFSSSP
jgi:hypothetical protein